MSERRQSKRRAHCSPLERAPIARRGLRLGDVRARASLLPLLLQVVVEGANIARARVAIPLRDIVVVVIVIVDGGSDGAREREHEITPAHHRDQQSSDIAAAAAAIARTPQPVIRRRRRRNVRECELIVRVARPRVRAVVAITTQRLHTIAKQRLRRRRSNWIGESAAAARRLTASVAVKLKVEYLKTRLVDDVNVAGETRARQVDKAADKNAALRVVAVQSARALCFGSGGGGDGDGGCVGDSWRRVEERHYKAIAFRLSIVRTLRLRARALACIGVKS